MGSAGETDGEGSRLVVVGRGRGPVDYLEHVRTWRPEAERQPHIVVSLLPDGWFVVDHLRGDPATTLQRWRRKESRKLRLPVAAFPFEDPDVFRRAAHIYHLGSEQPLTPRDAAWIRRAPLVSEWLRPVRLHAARYENAAGVLAQLRNSD